MEGVASENICKVPLVLFHRSRVGRDVIQRALLSQAMRWCEVHVSVHRCVRVGHGEGEKGSECPDCGKQGWPVGFYGTLWCTCPAPPRDRPAGFAFDLSDLEGFDSGD